VASAFRRKHAKQKIEFSAIFRIASAARCVSC